MLNSDDRGRLQWVTGWLSTRTLTTTRLSECWIHTGDVADALGRPLPPTDRLWHIARLAWRTIPYAFARADLTLTGPVAFELTAPNGSRWDFGADAAALTVVHGTAADVCAIAGRRATPDEVPVHADGPDAEAVLSLMRTYA
ncbi:maleylpyruvate isomerase family mycothiol-dependent enzyme [Fodinicola feengrottensis]|uniref:maleylpyruvate isomerase family mycothiol-dependent enzyme n=1 Tax=Fodinicola feengrottensis TaxID=435914 RepID=UPI0013D5AC85|nr:maleylpyruvate isomerase family mycothiol-dependent enzyme [Fodinicola feengrottensis]